MNTHTTGRGLALVAGFLASTGALAILVQDAIRTNVWTLEHGLIPVLMSIQILTAHLAIAALKQWRAASAIGFVVVAIVSTWGVLYTSVGKQSRVAAEQASAQADTGRQRADAERRLAANTAMLDGARARHAAECATGKGRRCDGILATVGVYEDAVSGNRAEIARLGPPAPVHTRADAMAALIATLAGSSRDRVRDLLLQIEPFTYATIFELAALVSFGFAFGGARKTRPASAEPSAADRAQTSFGTTPNLEMFSGEQPDPPAKKIQPVNVVHFKHPATAMMTCTVGEPAPADALAKIVRKR